MSASNRTIPRPAGTRVQRILVTGSRYLTDRGIVEELLNLALVRCGSYEDTVLVHGGAGGADLLAAEAWQTWGLRQEAHRADWNRYGRSAGPRRNIQMVALGADLCVAFFDEQPNRGTTHCSDIAERAGIPVIRVQTSADSPARFKLPRT
ncbi:MAG: DUF2493 domain-containing protein [Nakamurella sp.]